MNTLKQRRQSVYLNVAEEIAEEIRNGHFQPGERLYSRTELSDRFKISGKTAVRVQDALVEVGLIRKVHGSGIFVNYLGDFPDLPRDETRPPLKRIVYFTHAEDRWTGAFQQGIQSKAGQLRLDLRVEHIAATAAPQDVFTAYPAKAYEGYIAVATGANMHFATGALLLSPSVNSVFIDYIAPGTSCVITDNFDGIGKLVDYAASCGRENFIFASNCHKYLDAMNTAERELAFKMEMRHRHLRGTVIASANFSDLVDAVRSSAGPTAILFPQDDPALRCKKILHEAEIEPLPLILGFDDFAPLEKGLARLTTIRVDRAGMGAAAVELLAAAKTNSRANQIVRIPGELIVREQP